MHCDVVNSFRWQNVSHLEKKSAEFMNVVMEVNLRCNFIQADVAHFASLNVSDIYGWEKANDELLHSGLFY